MWVRKCRSPRGVYFFSREGLPVRAGATSSVARVERLSLGFGGSVLLMIRSWFSSAWCVVDLLYRLGGKVYDGRWYRVFRVAFPVRGWGPRAVAKVGGAVGTAVCPVVRSFRGRGGWLVVYG